MLFKNWMNESFEFKTREQLDSFLKTASGVQLKTLTEWIDQINKREYGKKLGTTNPVLLHHGSPSTDISTSGFKITQGQRSRGFMGAQYAVQNHGIFMTDSKPMAHLFGKNRSKYGTDYEVYDAYANLDRCLDAKTLPLNIRKVGLELINKYYGTKKGKLAESDIWWLLDQREFVDLIKTSGVTAVRFKESRDNRQQSDKTANSYLVFDPKHLIVKLPKNDLIKDVDTLWSYLQTVK